MTEIVPLFRISVYNKDREFQCQIGDPSELEAVIRFNDVSTLSLTVPLTHKAVPALMEDGARLKVRYRGEHLISGPVTADALDTDGKKGTYRITVEDDFRVLKEILGWQVPWETINNQGSREYKYYTTNAEAIVKAVVTENGVTRLAVPGLTVAPNLNRGAVVPGGVAFRMHPLPDILFPAVETAGLGVTVRQDDAEPANLVLDVFEPELQPKLSIKGGTIKKVGMHRTRPTASRIVVGGSGEGKERYFRTVIDTDREALYGMRAERFVDDRQAGSDYLTLVKDTGAANAELKEANGTLKIAENALDAANVAFENASQAYDLAEATGNASLTSSALARRTAANDKVASRLTDYNAAVAAKNTKQTAYNNLNTQLAAALTAYQAAMDDSGNKALTEHGPTNGVAITLAGAGIFQYGPGGFHVGDKAPIQVTEGIILTEVIRECTIKWVSPTHASTEPVVGERINQPERATAKRFAAMLRRLRNQETR